MFIAGLVINWIGAAVPWGLIALAAGGNVWVGTGVQLASLIIGVILMGVGYARK